MAPIDHRRIDDSFIYFQGVSNFWYALSSFISLFAQPWFSHRLQHFVHENLFSTPKSEIFGIKIFFLHENPRFCASKSFFCSKIRDSVHQNLFSARKSEILCIKIFFLHENLRFCAWKTFLLLKIRDFRYQNLFCLPNCGMERDTKRKRRMYHQELWYILLFLIRFTFHPRERNATPIRF